jgi:SulP family sulfate permease
MLIIVISMVIMEFSPKLGNTFRIFKVLPSALLAIAAGMIIEYALIRPLHFKTDVVGDMAHFSRETSIPRPFFLNPMFDMKNLVLDAKGWTKIFYQGFMLGAIGIIEGLLVLKVVDGFTGMVGQCDRQVLALGFGNVVAGFLSGMGGTGMIGLSTIVSPRYPNYTTSFSPFHHSHTNPSFVQNCLNGGQGRISSLVCALCVMLCIMGAYPVLNIIPVASLSGIIFIVVYRTFKWYTIDMVLFAFFPARWVINLGFPARKVNRADVIVILTVIVVTLTVNLFIAVLAGILLSIVIFLTQVLSGGGTFKYFRHAFTKPIYVSKKQIDSEETGGSTTFYTVHGPLFFGSFRVFTTLFDPYNETTDNVVIYLKDGRIYDYSSLEALNKVCKDYKSAGKHCTVMNLTDKSEALVRMSSGSNSRCKRLFSVGWILGDIELSSKAVVDTTENERVIQQDDIQSTETTYGFKEGFYTQADPDAFVIT